MSPPKKVLIADPDFESVRSLAKYLRSRGFHVQAVPDGAKALEMAILRQPDVILFDCSCQIIDAKNFFGILESNPRTAHIPVLVTAKDRALTETFKNGILQKPFNLDELVSRLEHLCRRAEASKSLKGDAHEIKGALDQLPLADLMQILAMNRRTGRLLLSQGSVSGDIQLREGQLINAHTDEVEGEKAFFRLIGLVDGSFSFKPQRVSGVSKIERGMGEALLEGMRHADETRRLLTNLPPLSTELSLRPEAALPLDPLPVLQEVIGLLTQPLRLAALLNRASAPDLEILSAVSTLLEKGLLRQNATLETALDQVLRPAQVHALRAAVMRGTPQNQLCAKVIVLGAGPKAYECIVQGLPGTQAIGADPSAVRSGFGTLARYSLTEAFHLEFVLAPAAEAARPLWRPFLQNALGALVLDPSPEVAAQATFCKIELRMPLVYFNAGTQSILDALRELLLLAS
jgi:DNA-binding response OmpR family regulator